jgi:hypothetical protein
MKKIAKLFLLLALASLPMACGGALDLPPVTEYPPANPPANPPQVPPSDIPPIEAVPTPEICAVDDEDCGDRPEVGIYTPPVYMTDPHYEFEIDTHEPAQIDPCLLDPEAEGC